MEIIYRRTAELVPYARNPRKNDCAVDAVASSIEQFGFNVPIIIDRDSVIVAGHTRLKAAKKLGLEEVPCIIVDDLTEEQVKAFRLADNKTGELASWDYLLLGKELESLVGIDMAAFELSTGDNSDAHAEKPDRLYDSNLDEGTEIDLSEFDDDVFENECPYCGFRW